MRTIFREFQSKADQVDAYPETADKPWTFAITGLLTEAGKMSRTTEHEPQDGSQTSGTEAPHH
jgi:hypothetical protein